MNVHTRRKHLTARPICTDTDMPTIKKPNSTSVHNATKCLLCCWTLIDTKESTRISSTSTTHVVGSSISGHSCVTMFILETKIMCDYGRWYRYASGLQRHMKSCN
ncbi:hypothetical protein ScPMuIL_012183 [Solemya velum]